jgi:hypothetical protein
MGGKKCPVLHNDGVILLLDNAQLHTAHQIQKLVVNMSLRSIGSSPIQSGFDTQQFSSISHLEGALRASCHL